MKSIHGDVANWGIAAMVCGALAVFAANIGTMLPESVLTGMHATRLQGGSFNQVRSQLVSMQAENTRVIREYRTLLARFNLLDDDSGEVVRRLAAVERSLPLLIESLPLNSDIDRSLLTASIGAASPEVYEADGGRIVVRHSALFDDLNEVQNTDQPIPPVAIGPTTEPIDTVVLSTQSPDTAPPGIAIGPVIARDAALEKWNGIMLEVGPLLLGTTPLMIDTGDEQATRIIAGPLPDLASASMLCDRLVATGLDCDPAPYSGLPLPPQ